MQKLGIATILVISGLMAGFSLPDSNKQYPEFRPHMQTVYSSLVQITPILLRDNTQLKLKEKEAAEIHFKNIAEHSAAISAIAQKGDTGHRILAEDLARNATAAYAQFKEAHYPQAQYFLADVVHSCFACHTSRDTATDSQFVTNFNKDIKWETFDPLARARFLTLSRQFDKAMTEYEKLFKDNTLSQDELINMDPIVEYMVIALRVKNEPDTVAKTLKNLQGGSYPEIFKKDFAAWLKALDSIKKEKLKPNYLEEAKNQLSLAKQAMEYPQDRSGLVRYIVASRLLQTYIQDKNLPAPSKADAYYQLGICEMIIGASLLSDESLAFFEQAIKLSPKSEISKKAFAQYEDIVRFGYSGSGGIKIPDEEKSKISELRKIAF